MSRNCKTTRGRRFERADFHPAFSWRSTCFSSLHCAFFPLHGMKLRSLSRRMALVFALLFTVVQASVLLLVDRVGLKIARERNAQELQVGQRVFLRLLDQNRQRLLQAADVLSR